jgi:hypothetical protein
MTILLNGSYIFNTIPIKISMTFFTEIEKSIIKFMWKHRKPQIAKVILSKARNARGIIIISNSKLDCRL